MKTFPEAVLASFGKVTQAKAKKAQARGHRTKTALHDPFSGDRSEFFHLLCHAAGLLEMYLGDHFVLTHTELLSLLGTFPLSSAPRTQPPEAVYALAV